MFSKIERGLYINYRYGRNKKSPRDENYNIWYKTIKWLDSAAD